MTDSSQNLLARWRRWFDDKLDGWAWERVGRQIGEAKRDEVADEPPSRGVVTDPDAIAWRQELLAQLTIARNELVTAYELAQPRSLERHQIAGAIDAATRAAECAQMNLDSIARSREQT